MWQAIEKVIDRRAKRLLDARTSESEKRTMQVKLGAEVIRVTAHWGGSGPYSEDELRTILRESNVNENLLLTIMWKMQDRGQAEKSLTFDGTVSWLVN